MFISDKINSIYINKFTMKANGKANHDVEFKHAPIPHPA